MLSDSFDLTNNFKILHESTVYQQKLYFINSNKGQSLHYVYKELILIFKFIYCMWCLSELKKSTCALMYNWFIRIGGSLHLEARIVAQI